MRRTDFVTMYKSGTDITTYFTGWKHLIMLAVVLLSAPMAKAQGSASTIASVSATVIIPITISKTSDMSLGKVVSDPTGATMTISSTGVRTFSSSANKTASNPNGTAATFHVTGDNSCTFSTVHTGIGAGAGVNGLFLDDGASHTMWFAIDGTTSQSLAGGAVDYKVTGTLTIPANQVAGSYSGSFTELVAYE